MQRITTATLKASDCPCEFTKRFLSSYCKIWNIGAVEDLRASPGPLATGFRVGGGSTCKDSFATCFESQLN